MELVHWLPQMSSNCIVSHLTMVSIPRARPGAALSSWIAPILPSPGSQLESAPGTHQPNNNLTSLDEKLQIPQPTCNFQRPIKGCQNF